MFVSMVYLVLFGRRHLCRGPFRARTSRLILASSLFFIFLFLSLSIRLTRTQSDSRSFWHIVQSLKYNNFKWLLALSFTSFCLLLFVIFVVVLLLLVFFHTQTTTLHIKAMVMQRE